MKTYENFINPKIKYWNNGQKRSEEWLLNGYLHREDGPAYQNWYENGQKWIETWVHREDGPSYQQWYENGQKWIEEWVLNDKYHRVNEPSYQSWYENGQKKSERWYLNGKLHREDGPSYQRWYKDGQKEYEGWWLNNKEYSREEWVEELKTIGSPHYLEQKMLLNVEKYNI